MNLVYITSCNFFDSSISYKSELSMYKLENVADYEENRIIKQKMSYEIKTIFGREMKVLKKFLQIYLDT